MYLVFLDLKEKSNGKYVCIYIKIFYLLPPQMQVLNSKIQIGRAPINGHTMKVYDLSSSPGISMPLTGYQIC